MSKSNLKPINRPISERQQAILDFIRKHIIEEGYPPTVREIGEAFGIRSTNGVNDHLRALERKGFLERESNKSRTMRPIDMFGDTASAGIKGKVARSESGKAPARTTAARRPASPPGSRLKQSGALGGELISVPILGKVAAGTPILAEENLEDSVQIDSFLLGGHRRVFGLKVSGDSMIGDGIFDGDFIFVRKQLHAENGQIVVAMIEGEATVKRFYREDDRIRFQPSNSRLQPIYVHADEFRETMILGMVVGVYRKMS